MAQVNTGHKVVAMPAPGEQLPPSIPSSPYHARIRSRSFTRNSVSRSRDIVQDVYNRMGVNYVKGQPSYENFTFNEKTTIDSVTDTKTGQESQSRGRPTTPTRYSEFGTAGNTSEQNQNETRTPPERSPPSWQKSVISDSHSVVSNKSLNFEPGRKVERRSMPHPKSSSPFLDTRDEDMEKANIHANDDERDNGSVVSYKSTRSLKDRISAYGASIRANSSLASPRATVHQSQGNNFRRFYDTKRNSTKDVVKETVLSPFHHLGQVPMVEIPNDQQPDLLSIAASSVSGEDFGVSPSPRNPRSSIYSVKSFGGGNQVSIEKEVEYRVQAQMTMINQKFDSEMRRIESRIEQECIVRIKRLEEENRYLTSLLNQMHQDRL